MRKLMKKIFLKNSQVKVNSIYIDKTYDFVMNTSLYETKVSRQYTIAKATGRSRYLLLSICSYINIAPASHTKVIRSDLFIPYSVYMTYELPLCMVLVY